MSKPRRIKRTISGVLLFDKPRGFSSNQALQKVRWLYQAEKAGHTGTLDPFATGLLPLCLGEATKFSQRLLDADKAYTALVKLGEITDTGDLEGEVIERHEVNVTRADIERVLPQFLGEIQQIPPMYSALKRDGKPLYEYARAGITLEREARTIEIFNLQLGDFKDDCFELEVSCSKGTYIRVLAEDIGKALGCGAHLRELRRTRTGGFSLHETVVTVEQLEAMSPEERDALLAPSDCLVQDLPEWELDADSAGYFRNGQPIWQPKMTLSGFVRIYDDQRRFLGLAEVEDGRLAPRRLVNF